MLGNECRHSVGVVPAAKVDPDAAELNRELVAVEDAEPEPVKA
jgi:hypothetical protein